MLRRPPWRLWTIVSLTLTCLLCATSLPGQTREEALRLEYAVKAAYLYNFVKFVDWPAARLPAADTAITVCILGVDPFGATIDPLAQRTAQGRRLRIERHRDTGTLGACHVIFVSASESRQLASVLAALPRDGVLTVGDSDAFARKGGVIGFITESGKVRLEINRAAARAASLRIRAQLLEVARLVE